MIHLSLVQQLVVFSFLYSLCAAGVHAGEGPNPDGEPFEVNQHQTGSQSDPAIAGDGQGRFVVVWDGSTGHDPDGVAARLYDAEGEPVGGDLQVNTATGGNESSAAVAMAPTGEFVVTWQSFTSDYPMDDTSVRGRRFDSVGTPLAGEFQIEASATGHQSAPSVEFTSEGNVVVVWQSDSSMGTDSLGTSIQARVLDSLGRGVTGEFQVNDAVVGDQSRPDVAAQPEGGFVVVWHSENLDATSVQARRFDSLGSPLGVEMSVTAFTTADVTDPSIATDADGNFVVTWTLGTLEAVGRRYEADGGDLGFFDIDVGGLETQVSRNAGGDHVVAYTGPSGNPWVKIWDADGGLLSGPFALPYSGDFGAENEATLDDDLSLVTVWFDEVGSGEIRGQRYVGRQIFSDGFETGDTSAWIAP